MSHFSTVVFGADIKYQMAPFHEYECTGVADEFVVDVDVTDEIELDYENFTVSRVVNRSTGENYSTYDDVFWRPATLAEEKKIENRSVFSNDDIGFNFRKSGDVCTVMDLPDGMEIGEVPISEVYSFEEYCTCYLDYPLITTESLLSGDSSVDDKKFSYVLKDTEGNLKIIKRTNPNAKWDYWTVGGRFTNSIPIDDEFQTSITTGQSSYRDAIKKVYDEVHQKFTNLVENHSHLLSGIQPPYEFTESGRYYSFMSQESVINSMSDLANIGIEIYDLNDFMDSKMDIEAYAKKSAYTSILPYSYVHQRKWHSLGRMGWFGSSSDNQDIIEWGDKFMDLIDSLPPDTQMTVVDCHI